MIILGVSNLKLNPVINRGFTDLLSYSLFKLNHFWNRFSRNGQFQFVFYNNENKKVTIVVRTSEESFVKQNSDIKWVIGLKEDERNVMFANFVHEITHISQNYNRFYQYVFRKTFKEYNNTSKKLTYNQYYTEYAHSNMETEHEAKLSSFLWYLKNNDIQNAYEMLNTDYEYFNFSNRKLLQCMYQFSITNLDNFNLIKNKFDESFQGIINTYKNNYINGYFDSLGALYVYFNDFEFVFKMLNLNYDDEFKFLKNEVLKNEKNLNSASSRYNWNFIISQLKIKEFK